MLPPAPSPAIKIQIESHDLIEDHLVSSIPDDSLLPHSATSRALVWPASAREPCPQGCQPLNKSWHQLTLPLQQPEGVMEIGNRVRWEWLTWPLALLYPVWIISSVMLSKPALKVKALFTTGDAIEDFFRHTDQMKPQDFNPNSMDQFWGGQQRNVQNWLGSEEIYALWAPNYMIQAPKSGPLGSSIFPQEQWHSHLMAWPSTMMIKTQMTNHTNFTSSFQLFQDLNILKYIESRSIKSWGLSNPKEWQSSHPEDWGS